MLFLLDILLVFIALRLAVALRYDGSMGVEFQKMNAKVVPITPLLIGLYMVALVLGGTYVSMWRYAGSKDLARLVAVCAAAALLAVALNYLFRWYISRAILMMMGMCAAALVGGSRLFWKMSREALVSRRGKGGTRILIVGAGESGSYAAKLSREGMGMAGTPVGFVDDDREKGGLKLQGIPVLGTTEDIPDIVRRKDIQEILIAIPNATGDKLQRIVDICRRTRCALKIVSNPGEVNDPRRQLIREVNTSDFLSRGEVKLDTAGIRGYLTGRTVLVTGGGGSIGSEICRQIMRFAPRKLLVFDIYENCAYELETELKQLYGADCPIEVLIGSIRDKQRLDEVFSTYEPEIVFHAAAHKHVPLMEISPAEAIKNNVFGTRNLLQSASEHGVLRLVQLSTDKAVNPTNVMGATKRITEMLMQQFARRTDMRCMAVRFGNVLGSHGSVIPKFEAQIKKGGPVTVTDPEMERYFMTIPEAAQLVLQAGAIAENGAIFVLDMGDPVRIMELAQKLIRFHGYTPGVDMQIEITGLRPGEKLYEELLMESEASAMTKTSHDKIFVAPPIAMDDDALDCKLDDLKIAAEHNDESAVDALQEIVTTYKPNREMLAG
ncbi:MAG: polysaccharide biosynthesis protein [Christensenellales bacterium]